MSQFPRPGATVLTTFVRTEPAPEMIEITIVATPHDIERQPRPHLP